MSPRIHERGRSGNYMMMMAVFLPVVIGFAALSVDISYINMAASQAQHVADAASHAAFIKYRDSGSKTQGVLAAEYILDRNKVGNATANLDSLNWGEWDYETYSFDSGSTFVNSAQAVVSRSEANSNPLNLFFAPILGVNKASVSGAGVTAGRSREMMLVTDVSGSFAEEIGNVRDAVKAFVLYMEENRFPEDKLGHALFAGRKNFPMLHDLMFTTPANVAVMKTQSNKLKICSDMTGALRGAPTSSTSCNTSQARGLHDALQEFEIHGDARQFQGLVLLTDGQANTNLKQSTENTSNEASAESDTEMIRDILWYGGAYSYDVWECPHGQANVTSSCKLNNYAGDFTGGIHIWSVYFGTSGHSKIWLEDLVDVPGNMGFARSTNTPNEIKNIFIEIASSIPVVLAK